MKLVYAIFKRGRGFNLTVRAENSGFFVYKSPKQFPTHAAAMAELSNVVAWQMRMGDTTAREVKGTCGWDEKEPATRWFEGR